MMKVMSRTRFILCAVFCVMLLLLSSAAPMQAAGRKKKSKDKRLSSYVWKLYKEVISQDQNKAFTAVLELEAVGADIIPYALKRMEILYDDSSMASAFILGRVEDPEVIDILLETLQNSKYQTESGPENLDTEVSDTTTVTEKGVGTQETENTTESNQDGVDVTETERDVVEETETIEEREVIIDRIERTVLSEKTRTYRDGFCCLSLGMQAERLLRAEQPDTATIERIRDQLRVYVSVKNQRARFVKLCAALALGMMKDESMVAELIELVENKRLDPMIRAASILAISHLPGQNTQATLMQLLAKDTATPKDESAKKGKKRRRRKKRRGKKKIDAALEILSYLQEHAALAIGSVGDDDCKILWDKDMSRFKGQMTRFHLWVSASGLKIESTLPRLREELEKEKDPKVRSIGARVLYAFGDKDGCFAVLEEIFNNPDVSAKDLMYTATLLGSINDSRSKDMLVSLVNHPKSEVQRLVVANLVKYAMGNEDIKQALISIVSKSRGDKIAKQQAMLAFRFWELTDANLKILKKVVRKGSSEMKRGAALSLSRRGGNEDAIDLLNKLMGSKDQLVRAYAAAALGTMTWDAKGKQKKAMISKGKSEKSYVVRRNIIDSIKAEEARNPSLMKDRLERYWNHESMVPRDIWEEYWGHTMNRLLLAGIQMSDNGNGRPRETTGDESTSNSESSTSRSSESESSTEVEESEEVIVTETTREVITEIVEEREITEYDPATCRRTGTGEYESVVVEVIVDEVVDRTETTRRSRGVKRRNVTKNNTRKKTKTTKINTKASETYDPEPYAIRLIAEMLKDYYGPKAGNVVTAKKEQDQAGEEDGSVTGDSN